MNEDEIIAEYLESGDESVLTEAIGNGLDPRAADEARSLRELLGEPAMWEEPSEDLLARIEAEVAMTPQAVTTAPEIAAPAPQEVPNVVDFASARERRSRSPRWVSAVAGVAAGALLVFGGMSLRNALEGPDMTVGLTAAALAPSGASGVAELTSTPSGFEIVLDIKGLPRAPQGFYYQGWLVGERGPVTIGTFHTGGRVVLWSGVDPKDYPKLTVTLEPEDGNPASSGKRVFQATL